MTNFRAAIGRLVRSEDGPTMVEYAAMILFLSLLCFAVLQAMGVEFQKLFNSLATTMHPFYLPRMQCKSRRKGILSVRSLVLGRV